MNLPDTQINGSWTRRGCYWEMERSGCCEGDQKKMGTTSVPCVEKNASICLLPSRRYRFYDPLAT